MAITSQTIRALISEEEGKLREPGSVLFSQSRYEILRVLGEGGIGITCLADEVSAANLKRPIVLKFVKDSLDPERLGQLLNEVQLSILFNHPNLVPVYRLESETLTVELEGTRGRRGRSHTHTVYYAVMQYIDGWNLREVVDRTRRLRVYLQHDIAMFIIGRVASGMNYVHEYRDGNGTHLGLVHRDLSPENVLIDRFGRIKVADFGITKAARDIRLTEANPGKLLYASPEQLTGGTLDARSDIYNIGLLMYLMMTNEDRFGPERNLPRARDRILRKMQRSVLGDLSHVDPRLAQMCEACLRVDPGKRYQTCEDLVTDIDIYFKDTGKVLTNEILEETLQDTFSADPKFVSRRFIALTGSPHLEQQGYEPRPGTPPENAPDDPALSTVDISPDPTT